MHSLALRHKQRVLDAQKQQKESKPAQSNHAPVYAQKMPGMSLAKSNELSGLKLQLENDLITLKQLSGDEEKAPFKKELIEKFRPLCEIYLQTYQTWAHLDVLFWWLLWRNDVEGFAAVQQTWYEAIEKGLTTPVKFNRDWQTMYLDEVFKHVDEQLKQDQEPSIEYLDIAMVEIEEGLIATNAPLKAKLYKLHGQALQKIGQDEHALQAYEKALKLDANVGVKTVIKQLKAKVKTND
ncbi:MAG: hypothetical protein JXR47_01520 [Thiotrichales bacterium]|nr:hypothetical protein [Thiotrichales bacterium]